MLEFYWACLIGGALFAVVTFLFSDLVGNFVHGVFDAITAHAHFFDPMVVVGGITVFGGSGVLLTQYTELGTGVVLILSLLIAVFLSMMVFFFYVKPMRKTETSTGFSIHDLVGKIAEVTVPLPVKGYGEVMVKVGAGFTNQIAASFDQEEIQAGTRVVVVTVKEDTLYVSRFENTLD